LYQTLGTYDYNMVSEHFIGDRACLALEGVVAKLLPPDPCGIVDTNNRGRPGQYEPLAVALSEGLLPSLL